MLRFWVPSVNPNLINHLTYADDLILMAPSVAGLSNLLRICDCLVPRMIFNQRKSACKTA